MSEGTGLTDAEIAAAVQGVLAVPLHRSLGVALVDPADPSAGLEIEVAQLALNNKGVLHGGLVPLLLDVASYLAVLPALEPGTNAVTTSVSASLLVGVQAGERVRFSGQVERRGRSVAFLSARARVGERVVATGQVVKSIVRG
ncbi:MAG TPA: PaaI family thioesterase [Solirubrobacteraceae bacterium]|nr:PaaI family thioesterase [Solirubrobacteraceae bacterium]